MTRYIIENFSEGEYMKQRQLFGELGRLAFASGISLGRRYIVARDPRGIIYRARNA